MENAAFMTRKFALWLHVRILVSNISRLRYV
jgi:hypothetical protein